MYRYGRLVDDWVVYDNAAIKTPTLVAQSSGQNETIFEKQKWQTLLKLVPINTT